MFSCSVTVFQLLLKLQLLQTFKLHLQLQITDLDVAVISPFQLLLLLAGFILVLTSVETAVKAYRACAERAIFFRFKNRRHHRV